MTTLREAALKHVEVLENLVQLLYEYGIKTTAKDIEKSLEDLRAALAQPEKERDRGGACVVVNGTSGVFTIHLPGNPSGGGISPAPQREWHGLTDEEIQEAPGWCGGDYELYARSIERILREKNT